MLDFTLLSDRLVELMQVGGVLFFIALGAFAYILLAILINVFKYKKKIADKNDDYLICDVGDSFDAKGEEVISHGGISIDECVVPFIMIKAVENNG